MVQNWEVLRKKSTLLFELPYGTNQKDNHTNSEGREVQFCLKITHVRRQKGIAENLKLLVWVKNDSRQVVDNIKSNTLSKVKLHGEFKYSIHSGSND